MKSTFTPIVGVLLIAPALFSYSTFASEKRIILEVSQSRNYEVVYDRASSSATGAALAGFVGAAIESGIDSGNDSKKRKKLDEFISDPACSTNLYDALKNKLSGANFEIIDKSTLSKKEIKKTLTLRVNVQQCGFKKTDTNTGAVSSFVRAKVGLKQHKKTVDNLGKTAYLLGKNQYSFESLLESGEQIQKELSSVLERAGKKIANKVIYRK